jgi:hypothetical protein
MWYGVSSRDPTVHSPRVMTSLPSDLNDDDVALLELAIAKGGIFPVPMWAADAPALVRMIARGFLRPIETQGTDLMYELVDRSYLDGEWSK